MRCTSCAYPVSSARRRCPACGGNLCEATFGPNGQVWSSTVVHVSVPGQASPYGLAYVDLEDGPRILAHFRPVANAPLVVGAAVRLVSLNVRGDLEVEPSP